MKSRDRLLAAAGANMNESMGGTRLRGAGGGESRDPFPPTPMPSPAPPDRYHGLSRVKGAFLVPLDRVAPDPRQPRKDFDPESLDRLAQSLKDRGQLQPIRVRWDEPAGGWVIIAGERRWRAAGLAGLPHVAAVEATAPLTEDEILEEQLIENCLRDDLRPVEQAVAFKGLMERRGWNQKQLAEALQVHPSAVNRSLSLLDLPAPVRRAVDDGTLAPSAAVELTRLSSSAEQIALAGQAVEAGLNRAEVAAIVETRAPSPRKKPERPKPYRVDFVFDDGSVSVTLKNPEATPRAVSALLKSALGKVQSSVRLPPMFDVDVA